MERQVCDYCGLEMAVLDSFEYHYTSERGPVYYYGDNNEYCNDMHRIVTHHTIMLCGDCYREQLEFNENPTIHPVGA